MRRKRYKPPSNLPTGRICYDLSYGSQAQFARWAQGHGAKRVFDGLGMLVEQAAESYSIWMGNTHQRSRCTNN